MTQSYRFELKSGTESTQDLLVRGPRKRNKRILIGIGIFLTVALILGVVLGVTLNKSKEKKEDNEMVTDAQKGSKMTTKSVPQSTTTVPGTQTTQPFQSTTSGPVKDWIQEPCKSKQNSTCTWSSNPVLLISLDGFRAEYLTRNLTPTLQRIASCGVHTPYMRSVYPTLTFPNHYTIVTGLYPESHGIVDNNMYDPVINSKFTLSGSEKNNPAWWGGEPLWITAKKQGKRTASYFWVGSEVNISGIMPDIYYPYDGSVTYETRVDKVIEWLTLPEKDRPDFITLYFDEPDHTGHGSGPESPEVDAMLERMDTIIARLMNGLYKKQIHNCVNLIILADHGMESTSCDRRVYLNQYINTSQYLIYDGVIGRIHNQFYEEKVGSAYVVRNNTNALPLDNVKELLKCKSGHIQMFDKTTIPVRHHYSNNQRIGDLILDMEDRWVVARNSHTYCLKGNHGFDNLYKSMQALFLAHGPDFKEEIQSDPFENIELYNLMCELLKITPAPNNGTMGSLNHLLVSPPPSPTSHTPVLPTCTGGNMTNTTDTCFCSQKMTSSMFSSTGSYSSLFGKPEVSMDSDICGLSNNVVCSGYSKTKHMPLWSSFILYKNKTLLNTTGTCINVDPRVPAHPCGSYSNSSQSISHQLIVNPGLLDGNSIPENSLSSGIVPMYDGFKDGIWNYAFKLILDYANQRLGMEVIVGPAFDQKSNEIRYINDGPVPLPSHFYIMVMACKQGEIINCTTDNLDLLSFILPHIPNVPNCMPEEDYLMENVARIRDIELLSGVQFLRQFPGDISARLRTFLPTSLWTPSKMSLKWKDLPCSAPNTQSCPGKIPLVLISLDGFRADYLKRKLTPVIEKLRTCGVHTPYMRSMYPTVTFPNHYTIVTGLYPESHGIISNNMYDKEIGEVFTLSSQTKADPRWWGGEPIWNTAQKQGKKAYTFFWPGSDVNISGSYPDKWVGYDGQIGFPERLEKVIEWLTLPEDQKPDIVTLYFDEPDHAGHQKGPESELVNGQLETVDEMLGRLMNKLYEKNLHDCVNLIVIADHGMDDVSCSNLVKLPEYMPDDIHKVLVFDGTFGRIENDYERISKYKVNTGNFTHVPVSKITDDLMCKNPAMKVFTKETVPKRFHYFNHKRIGDVLLDIQDRWLVTDTNTFWCTGGNHGWDNLDKSMHALFLAHGPAFKQQMAIDPFENIELYNLMSDVIGITPAPNNGTHGALYHILAHPKNLTDIPTSNQPSHNITNPVPLCECSSLDFGSIDLSPDMLLSLPFGVPVTFHGHMYTRSYNNTIAGFTDRNPLWSTVYLEQNKAKDISSTCYVNDIDRSDISCHDYTNDAMNISLQTLHNYDPYSNVNFLSSSVPMFDGFKNGIWKFIWKLSMEYSLKYGNISITTGPVYDVNGDGLADLLSDNISSVNMNSSVPLPTHFYMIMMKCKDSRLNLPCNSDIDVQSFILPHVASAPNCLYDIDYLKDNVVRLRDIELVTGLQFLTQNIDQILAARIRTYLPVDLWVTELTQTWLEKPVHLETCNSEYKPLILISLDGFRADYLLRNFTPYVRKLSQSGVHAPYMRSVYPTKTFPNHYSIVTGLYPESHGIIDNNMYDDSVGTWFGMSKPNASDPRWWKGEPFWNTVKKNNKTSATYFWPGSDVQVQGMYPDIWKKYDGKIPFSSRVDEVLSWLELPSDKRPDFITLYFDEPDHAGHSYGPDDIPRIGIALDKVDEAIGRLMEGLYHRSLHNCVNLIIVADHGMSDTACDRLITARDYITQYNNMYIYEGAFSRINPTYRYGSTHPRPVAHPVPVSDIVANMSCQSPHMKIFEKSRLPKRHHYANSRRIDDIIVDMEDKWLFTYRAVKTYQKKFCEGGNHGYDNIYKSMNALFLAHGPSFKQNLKTEPFENIELYNLMTALLNISGASNNGTAGSLNHILRNPPPVKAAEQGTGYSGNVSMIIDVSLSEVCKKQCPTFGNLNKTETVKKSAVEEKHLPFGIPVLHSVPRSSVQLLYQPTHITGYDTETHNPLWISYSLRSNESKPDRVTTTCILPDRRVTTSSVNEISCSMAENIPTDLVWKSLNLKDNSQSSAFDRISSVFVPVYKSFTSGLLSGLTEKLSHWLLGYRMLNVISGPVYDYNYDGLSDNIETINRYSNSTAWKIPSHIFLIITRCESGESILTSCLSLKTISFILPNIPKDNNCQTTDNYLTDNEARIRDIELITGLHFFVNHKDNVSLRTFLPHGLWTV